MDCTETRTLMLAARRGQLVSAEASAVRDHLASCEACRCEDAADAELSKALDRMPLRPASEELRRSLEARWAPAAPRRSRGRPMRTLGRAATVVALGGAIAAGTALWVRASVRASDRSDALFAEAVNDHLRVLYSDKPVEVESGGIHQVKPWFTGRLDFAPSDAFGGDADFPLKGGSVAYFVDRKAAAFVYGRRLHTITLFIFRAEGLPWPADAGEALGGHRAYARTTRGFHELLWRDQDLGYALVSDVSAGDLHELAERVVGAR